MIFLHHRVVAEEAPAGRCFSPSAVRIGAFRRQVAWLSRRFRIVPLREYLTADRRGIRGLASLTIDDAIWSTFRLVQPELRQRGLSVTIFLPTAHLETGELYWFSYFDALCFEGPWPSIELDGRSYPLGSDDERRRTRRALKALAGKSGHPARLAARLGERYRLSSALVEEYRSMTRDEVRKAAQGGGVDFGCHTVSHPYLNVLPAAEQFDQIAQSRKAAQEASGQSVDSRAYPGGGYNRQSVEAARAAGISAAFACVPHQERIDWRLEIGRMAIDSPSVLKLMFRSMTGAGADRVAR